MSQYLVHLTSSTSAILCGISLVGKGLTYFVSDVLQSNRSLVIGMQQKPCPESERRICVGIVVTICTKIEQVFGTVLAAL